MRKKIVITTLCLGWIFSEAEASRYTLPSNHMLTLSQMELDLRKPEILLDDLTVLDLSRRDRKRRIGSRIGGSNFLDDLTPDQIARIRRFGFIPSIYTWHCMLRTIRTLEDRVRELERR